MINISVCSCISYLLLFIIYKSMIRNFLLVSFIAFGDSHSSSTVVFWVARGKPSPCQNHRLLGEQRGKEIFRPLPEFEALVGIQDQPLNECLRLLTTRFPNGFDG